MAVDFRSILIKVVPFVYNKIVAYVRNHPELNGYELRLKIRSIFGTSLSAAQLDAILRLARRGA